MRTIHPESMTTEERSTDIASILAIGLVRVVQSNRSTNVHFPKEVSDFSLEALEDQNHADLSVSTLGLNGSLEYDHHHAEERMT